MSLQANGKNAFDFPKAELHCHLDGCFRLSTIIDIAKKRGVSLPSHDPAILAPKACTLDRKKDLTEYLESFQVSCPAFAGCIDAISRVTYEAIEDKFRCGVRYLELRFAPHLLANCEVEPLVFAKQRGDVTPRMVLECVLDATEKAEKEFNITVRLILCCILSFPDWSMDVAKFCLEYADRGVVAIDVAGPIDHQSIEDHLKAFEFCKANGIHITAHAGENGDAEEVSKAINLLFAERIGHGYHTVDDENVYAESKRRNIHFEVCPISSYRSASVTTDLSKHPAIRFMKEKVNFSINSDDPGIQQTDLLDDYQVAFDHFKFTIDQLKQLNLNALQSAFCDESLKARLLEEFKSAYMMK